MHFLFCQRQVVPKAPGVRPVLQIELVMRLEQIVLQPRIILDVTARVIELRRVQVEEAFEGALLGLALLTRRLLLRSRDSDHLQRGQYPSRVMEPGDRTFTQR